MLFTRCKLASDLFVLSPMKHFVVFTQFLTLAGVLWGVKSQEKVVICQYQEKNYPLEEIAPDGFCTHLAMLADPDDILSGNMLQTSYTNKILPRLNRLKERNPSLKTLLGIQAYLVKKDTNYEIIFQTLDVYGYSGMDIYWFLPYWELTDLGALQELKRRLEKSDPPRILSVSLVYIPEKIHEVKLVKEVGVEADLFTLAPFNRQWDREVVVSPMGVSDLNYIVLPLDYLIRSKIIPREKLVLGLPFFGMQTTPEEDIKGYRTYQSQLLLYKWICEKLTPKSTPWVESWDAKTLTPFLLNNETGQIINFDNVESLKIKAELLETKKLRGIAVFDVHSDDTTGVCGGGKYPLITALQKYLLKAPFSYVTNVKNEVMEFF